MKSKAKQSKGFNWQRFQLGGLILRDEIASPTA